MTAASGRAAADALSGWLSHHQPTDAAEQSSLQQMGEWLSRLERPFARESEAAHFTGSALVVSASGNRVCLLHHRSLDRWLQPGGHCETEDQGNLLTTALREAYEETGLTVRAHPDAPLPLDVDVHRIPEKRGTPAHWHLDVRFLLQATTDAAPRIDPLESVAVKYCGWEEAEQLAADPSLHRLLQKARRIVG